MDDVDPFAPFRGHLDDRVLDDERLPEEERERWGREAYEGRPMAEIAREVAEALQTPVSGGMHPRMADRAENEAYRREHPDEERLSDEEIRQAREALFPASDLAPPPDEEIPPPPEASAPPRGELVECFRIERNRFGAGTWGIDFVHSDGTLEPVMVWAARTHPDESGPDLAHRLQYMGLPQEHAVRLGRQREREGDGADVIVIPDDIEEVWGQGKLDGNGLPAISTARMLIAKWGIEGFRNSAIHKAALADIQHYRDKDDFSKAFVAAQNRKRT